MATDEAGDRGLTRNGAVIALALAALVAAGLAGVTIAAPNAPSGATILNETADRYASAAPAVRPATRTVHDDPPTRHSAVSSPAAYYHPPPVSATR